MDGSNWSFVRQGFWNAVGGLALASAVVLVYGLWQSRRPKGTASATQASSGYGCGG